MKIPNLILVTGTGSNSGKTSMVCRIIEQFSHLKIISIKISPHYHETTTGLVQLSEKKGYSIYKETNTGTYKDTSRMLRAGAEKVFFAQVRERYIYSAFCDIMGQIPANNPIVCESAALRNYVDPGMLVIMTSKEDNTHKTINHLIKLHHVQFTLEELQKTDPLPFNFEDGMWFYRK
jgi:hypothetical protein